MVEVSVSPATGYRLQGVAQNTARAQAPASAKPLRYSPYERTLFVTGDERMMVCSLCWDRQDVKTIQKVVYPLEIARHLGGAARQYVLPPHNPDCPALAGENPISITYPQPSSLLFIPRGADGQYHRLSLRPSTPAKEGSILVPGRNIPRPDQGIHHQVVSLEPGSTYYLVDEDGYAKTVASAQKDAKEGCLPPLPVR